MIRWLPGILALAIAAPLSASWWPTWTPSYVQLVAGQATTVELRPRWSGLVDYGGGIHWSFRSDNPHVATAFARAVDSQVQSVPIVAVGPGRALLCEELPGGGLGNAWVIIDVTCGPEPPVRAVSPESRGRVGEPLSIAASSEIAARAEFHWYLGRDGDRSHPLEGIGSRIFFTPSTYGTQYLWVSATTPCSSSTAEFRVNVEPPRRRVIQH